MREQYIPGCGLKEETKVTDGLREASRSHRVRLLHWMVSALRGVEDPDYPYSRVYYTLLEEERTLYGEEIQAEGLNWLLPNKEKRAILTNTFVFLGVKFPPLKRLELQGQALVVAAFCGHPTKDQGYTTFTLPTRFPGFSLEIDTSTNILRNLDYVTDLYTATQAFADIALLPLRWIGGDVKLKRRFDLKYDLKYFPLGNQREIEEEIGILTRALEKPREKKTP